MTAEAVETSRTHLETRALRMLAAGDSPKDVSQATGLSREELDRLRRDFPSTTTAQPKPAQPCDFAGCRGIATTRAAGWAFCESHARAHAQEQLEAAKQPPTAAGAIGRLLEDASGHTVGKVRRLGEKIETLLDELRALIADHDEVEKAKRKALAERAAAAQKVKDLEEQLKQAKAALRAAPSVHAPAFKASGEPLPCRKGCDRVFNNPQGRGKHERSCGGAE